jgi:hypothetical protein
MLLALLPGAASHAADEPLAARYDRLLAAHEYGKLAADIQAGMGTAATVGPTLDWEKQRFAAGASIFVGAFYAVDLLAAGHGIQDAAACRQTRENAVMVAFYTAAVIEIDGLKCADPEAQTARRRQFTQILTPAWAELKALPDETVEKILGRALTEEALRAGKRPPDDYLCRGRTDDIPDTLKEAGQAVEPRFVPADDWGPRADAVRKMLPALLVEFTARLKEIP